MRSDFVRQLEDSGLVERSESAEASGVLRVFEWISFDWLFFVAPAECWGKFGTRPASTGAPAARPRGAAAFEEPAAMHATQLRVCHN